MSAWSAEPESLSLVSQGAELEAMIAEAARWAEHIMCSVTGPQSARGTLPGWGELLARISKSGPVYVRQAERAEGWLLQRLHAAGALRLVDGGGQQPVASQLLVFLRGAELRAVLAHVPLERAVAGAEFGALLAFRGDTETPFAEACLAQMEGLAALARVPTGREVDVLTLDARRQEPAPALELPSWLRIVVDPAALAEGLERFGIVRSAAEGHARGVDGARMRRFAGGYRLWPEHEREAPFALTLHEGYAWASGNALLLDAGAGRSLLVWRGGLLGPSVARAQLLWSEARLESFVFDDPALGFFGRVAVVADCGAPLGPQLAAFVRELRRLCAVFDVQPPPSLGHVLSEFGTLSPKQRTLLVWKALAGAGALELDRAVAIAMEALRSQGYLRSGPIEPRGSADAPIAELLATAADAGAGFDRPSPDRLRAIQPDAAAYEPDDWLECLLLALPERSAVARRTALRLAFEHARAHWGLVEARLRRGGFIERALSNALATALCQGLLVRVGAGRVQRQTRADEPPEPPPPSLVGSPADDGFLDGWLRGLDELDPLQRFLVTRSAGWYGAREPLDGLASRLGLPLDRTRRIAHEAWRRLSARSGWGRALRARLERAFGGARALRVSDLVQDDAWWRGVEAHFELADALFEQLLDGECWRLVLGPRPRDVFFARFAPDVLERARRELLERAARVETPCPIEALLEPCREIARDLDEALVEDLRDVLEARLRLDPDHPGRVLGFEPPGTLEGRAGGEGLARSARAADSADFERLARDVPGGSVAIAALSNAVAEVLEGNRWALDPNQLEALVEAHAPGWSPELVRGLLLADPVLRHSESEGTALGRWPEIHPSGGALTLPGMPASMLARFEAWMDEPLESHDDLVRRLEGEIARLDRADDGDDVRTLPLARQLGDVCLRLVRESAEQEPMVRALALAAARCVLAAVAPDEADVEAPAVEAERVDEARAVLRSVTRGLGLAWI